MILRPFARVAVAPRGFGGADAACEDLEEVR
jgi:hypothetical protein